MRLLGAIFFNISTGEALDVPSVEGQREFVWGPDVDGSTAFLISGLLALVPLLRRGIYWSPSDRVWTSTWLNLFGSIAFTVSAIASIVEPDDRVKGATVASIATFTGAICFLLAAACYCGTRPTSPDHPGSVRSLRMCMVAGVQRRHRQPGEPSAPRARRPASHSRQPAT